MVLSLILVSNHVIVVQIQYLKALVYHFFIIISIFFKEGIYPLNTYVWSFIFGPTCL